MISMWLTLKSAPTFWMSFSIMPVLMWTIFIGINPNKVAKKNLDRGTSSTGDDMLMKKFGTKGVILRKSR